MGTPSNDEDETPDDRVGRRDDIDSRSLGTGRSRDGGADRRTGDGVRERPGPYRGRGSAPGPGVRHEGRPVRLCRLCRGRPALRCRGGRGRGLAGTVRDAGHRRRAHPSRPGRPLGRPVGAGGGPRRERTARRDRQDAAQAEGGDAGLAAAVRRRSPVGPRDRAGDVGCGRVPAARAAQTGPGPDFAHETHHAARQFRPQLLGQFGAAPGRWASTGTRRT